MRPAPIHPSRAPPCVVMHSPWPTANVCRILAAPLEPVKKPKAPYDRAIDCRKGASYMPEMRLQSYGSMAVDWEERVRLDRLREERLARIKALLAASELGALLCFDMGNIRYITATHIGTWAADKLNRFCL